MPDEKYALCAEKISAPGNHLQSFLTSSVDRRRDLDGLLVEPSQLGSSDSDDFDESNSENELFGAYPWIG